MAFKLICELCGKESNVNEFGALNEVNITLNSNELFYVVACCAECNEKIMNDIKAAVGKHKRLYKNIEMLNSGHGNNRATF